jgi:hypothetical protein
MVPGCWWPACRFGISATGCDLHDAIHSHDPVLVLLHHIVFFQALPSLQLCRCRVAVGGGTLPVANAKDSTVDQLRSALLCWV